MMKAVRLFGQDDLRVVSVPVPEIGDSEILVKTGAAMICGTDVRMHRNGNSILPITLGHEFAGTVAAVGSRVTGYREGMRVAVAPNYGCGVCDWCVAGQTQNCVDLQALGIHIDGGFAEYVRIPAQAVAQGNVCPIGDDLSFAHAALAEPFSCVYNSFERSRLQPGETVVVIGAGPIGLLHAKLYRAAGAGMVIINDMNEARLAACRKEDPFFETVNGENAKGKIMALTRGRGANVVVTAASAPATQQLAFELPAVNGRVIFFGGLPKDREIVPLNTNVIHYRQITVTGTSRQSLGQYRKCLELIRLGLVDVRGVITAEYGLDDAAKAFDDAAKGVGLKTGFVFDRE
ncbi:MAG: alcohol dehydrogenase catalytic domain-containing protein [Rectinema sp.]